jgi:hypothetical protein
MLPIAVGNVRGEVAGLTEEGCAGFFFELPTSKVRQRFTGLPHPPGRNRHPCSLRQTTTLPSAVTATM